MARKRHRRSIDRSLSRIVAALPLRWVLTLGDAAGTLLAHVDRRGRAVALENITVAFGESTPRERQVAILLASRRASLRSTLLRLRGTPMHGPLPRDGVLVTGRIGGWGHLSSPGRAVLVEREPRFERDGSWVPFLGLPAWTCLEAHRRAREGGLPVRTVLLLFGEDGLPSLWVGPDLAAGVKTEDHVADAVEIATRANGAIEHVIRARPDLWDWTFPRFRRRPTPELGPYPRYSRWVPGPK